MAIKTSAVYTTSDNKSFTVEAEALAHEAYLEREEVIEAYIASTGAKPPQAGTLRRHLPLFENFAANYVPGTFKLPSKDKAAEGAAAEGAAE